MAPGNRFFDGLRAYAHEIRDTLTHDERVAFMRSHKNTRQYQAAKVKARKSLDAELVGRAAESVETKDSESEEQSPIKERETGATETVTSSKPEGTHDAPPELHTETEEILTATSTPKENEAIHIADTSEPPASSAMEPLKQGPTEKERKGASEKEQVLPDQAFELIRSTPGFEYLTHLNGRPFGKREFPGHNFPERGWRTFYFDKQHNRMAYDESDSAYAYHISSDDTMQPPNKLFFRIVTGEKEDGTFIRYQIWMNFSAPPGNEFTEETRPGVYFSSAFQYRNTPDNLAKLPAALKERLQNPHDPESQQLFWELLQKCNREWMPEYWNFVKDLERK